MIRPTLIGLGALSLLLGCDDSTPRAFGATADAGPTADSSPGDDGDASPPGGADAAPSRPPVGSDAGPPPGEPPAFVRLSLEPRATVYARAEPPRVVAEVFDRFGDALPDATLSWSVVPVNAGAVTPDPNAPHEATLRLDAEGPGAVRACARPDVCGRATFFVDDAGASLRLDRPRPGEVIVGAESVIPVEGTAAGGDAVRVFVNDVEVDVGPEGRFATTVPARFGFNRIDVLADDGVRRPPAREILEAVWAPRVQPVPAAGPTPLPDVLVLRVDQRLLDDAAARPVPDEAGVLRTRSLAGLLEALVARIDLGTLLESPNIAEGEPLSLQVTAARPGEPDAALLFTDTGLEVFVRLDGLAIDTAGALLLEGERFDLGGTVEVDAAGVVRVAIEPGPDGAPGLRIEAIDVAIERLRGRMNDSTAQAVLDTLGSLLRGVLEGVARDLVDTLMRSRVPAFIELGLGDALAPLREVPLDVADDPLLPPIHLRLGFSLATPETAARSHLDLRLDGTLESVDPPPPPFESRGVPIGETDPEAGPPWPVQVEAAAAVRLFTVNALLHAVWQQGALRIDATPLLPENLRNLVSSARVDARAAPLVVAAPPGSPTPLELQLGELELELTGPNRPGPDVYALSVRAGLVFELVDEDRLTVRLDIVDDPDIRAVLRSSASAAPVLSPDALAQILEGLAWPKVREAVGNGLEFSLDPFTLDASTLGAIVPDVGSARVRVTVPSPPRVGNDWIVISAGIEVEVAP